jgi:outer membrane autotransporter protein
LLHGAGWIFGNLLNSGNVTPGDAPGTIGMTGDYLQSPTGTLSILLDRKGHSLLQVLGRASLGGTLQLVPLDNFSLQPGDKITILTANQGVIGKFANVIDPYPKGTISDPTVVYSTYGVALETESFSHFASTQNLTPNEKAVAGNLDRVTHDPRAETMLSYLDFRPLRELPSDFDRISPDALTSIFTIGTALATEQSLNLQRRTEDIRAGSSGFSAAGLAINGAGPSYSGGFGIGSGVAGPNGNDGKESKEIQPAAFTENRWGAFLSGTGEWVNVSGTDNARGYELTNGGFTLGIDYKVCPNFAIGLMGGYTGTTADLPDHGRVWVNGGNFGIYATFFQNPTPAPAPTMSKDSKEVAPAAPSVGGGFYADVAAMGGYSSYDTRRSGLAGTARGDTDGGNINALFGAGYDFNSGGLTFGPTASFNYTYTGTNGFTEHDSLAPLNIHGGQGESLRTAFGFKASYDCKLGNILFRPELRAAWQHEYGDNVYMLDSSFANGAGGNFAVSGPKLGRDSALIGAGFAVQFSERVSTYLYYDGELGRENYLSNSVTGGVRIAF